MFDHPRGTIAERMTKHRILDEGLVEIRIGRAGAIHRGQLKPEFDW